MARTATKTALKATKAAKAQKTTTPRARKAAPKAKALTDAEADKIVTIINDRSGAHVVASSAGGATVSYNRNRETAELRELAVKGGSIKALSKAIAALPPKQPAHVAKGVDSRNSPQTMATVRSQREAAKATEKTEKPPKADKKAAKAERKAARAAKAAPKSDDNRKITVVDKKFTFGGEGTSRRASWDAVKSGMSVADYIKAGGKAKYLPRWVSAGAIKLA